MTILAVGATGRFAGMVVPELARRGARVRGFLRDRAQADAVLAAGAAEVAVGDLNDRASVYAAMEGISAVFLVTPMFAPNEAEMGRGVVEAAVRAGVRRIVFSGVIHPVLHGLANHRAKAEIEDAILLSGLEYVLLHPSSFFQNYERLWPGIVSTGELAEFWLPEARFNRVDYRDVAEAAARALTGDELLYGTFELCSGEAFTSAELATVISEVTRRTIRPVRSDLAALAALPELLRVTLTHHARHGLRGNALTLSVILGREPRTLRAYFQELSEGTS